MRNSAGKCRHIVAAVVYADDQFIVCQAFSDSGEVWPSLAAVAVYLVAINASLVEKDLGAERVGFGHGGHILTQWNSAEIGRPGGFRSVNCQNHDGRHYEEDDRDRPGAAGWGALSLVKK